MDNFLKSLLSSLHYCFYFFFFFFFLLRGLWDLSFLTRDGTALSGLDNGKVLTTGSPGKTKEILTDSLLVLPLCLFSCTQTLSFSTISSCQPQVHCNPISTSASQFSLQFPLSPSLTITATVCAVCWGPHSSHLNTPFPNLTIN